MNRTLVKRLIRLSIGLFFLSVPLFAFFSLKTLPSAENAVQAAPLNQGEGPIPETTEETQTAVAQTQTSFAQTVQAAATQTALSAAMTSIAQTQTSVAKTQTAVAEPSSTAIYVDAYEPNNSIEQATTVLVDAPALQSLTLWPAGDNDFFRFVGYTGRAYTVQTSNLSTSLDTVLTIYDPQGNFIAENDNYETNNNASRVTFSAGTDGYYFARVINQSPGDPANKTYRFQVEQAEPTATPTAFPTGTRVPGADACEYNGNFDAACLIGVNGPLALNFVPVFGEGPDNDFFRLWVKPGIFYTCETFDLSSVNDTNMIIYDQNKNGLAGNDDIEPGNLASRVSYLSTYTGWLYILVGPVAPPTYGQSYLYEYSLRCTETVAPPTSTPTSTRLPSAATTPVPKPPTPTPFTPAAGDVTPTPFLFESPTFTATPNIIINPLPTRTPAAGGGQTLEVNVTVYYDGNLNFTPELTEGIEYVTVTLYDNATNELLAFGYTNEAGTVRFGPLAVPGAVRVSIPYLQFNQVVVGNTNIIIRIAPM